MVARSGTYSVHLAVKGHTASTSLVLKPGPRVHVPDADQKAHLAFALQARDEISRVTRCVAAVAPPR